MAPRKGAGILVARPGRPSGDNLSIIGKITPIV
jgi:hypothetical protein